MIIERYLVREILLSFLGVSAMLLLIFLSATFIRLLSDAADGEFPVDIVLQLFALKSTGNLVFIMPFALFITVLLALGRLYKDSEMAAMTACGIGPGRLLGVVGALSAAVAAVLGFMTLYVVPLTESQADALIAQAQARNEIQGIIAGRFSQPVADGPLLYVEDIDDGRMGNVFVHAERDGGQHILMAARARQVRDPVSGDSFVVFEDGHRYEGDPGSADFRVIAFERHGVRLLERDVAPHLSRNAMSTAELLRSTVPHEVAELHWRLAVPTGALILGLLAVPLAHASPRQGRYGRLFVGVLLYIVYTNLLTLGRSELRKGDISPELGLWWAHGIALALVVVLLWRQRRLRAPKEAT